MINRSVNRKDIAVYFLIVFIIASGFINILFPLIAKTPLVKAYRIFTPMFIIGHVLTPKASIVAGTLVLLAYSSKRFFDSAEITRLLFFGIVLLLAYRYNVMLEEGAYLFPVMMIIIVPQFINTFVYMIFKRRFK